MSNSNDVTDAELAVLELLWDRECATIREMSETIYPGGGRTQHATIQKLCQRLHLKGHVEWDRSVRPSILRATATRSELIGNQLKHLAKRLCRGSMAPLFTHLVEVSGLAPDEIERLRAEVEQLDKSRDFPETPGGEKS